MQNISFDPAKAEEILSGVTVFLMSDLKHIFQHKTNAQE